jgi:hypothetical protein
LRRASIAGLATIATTGLVVASAGSALAFSGAAASIALSSTPTTVFAGSSAQAAGDLTILLPNRPWNIGDTITLTVTNAANCNTTANTIGVNGTPVVGVTLPGAAAGTDTKPTVTEALSSTAGACTTAGVKDIITLTISNSGDNTGDGVNGIPTITLSALKFNLGTAPTAANVVLTAAVTSTGSLTPTFTGNPVTVANITNVKVSTTVVGSVPSGTNVAINSISTTDVTGSVFTGKVQFSLPAGDFFVTKVAMTPPSGVTTTTASETTFPSNTLTYSISGTVPANGVFTIPANKVNLTAALGDHAVTVHTGAALATLVGTGNVVVVANESRIGGIDRYFTAANLYAADFAGQNTAVLTSGTNFPDALSANVLASNFGTGILTTDPNILPTATSQALKTHPISTVYIVGGPVAVSTGIENQIDAMHVSNNPANPLINAIRVQGPDRYATNNAVNLFTGDNGPGGTAIVATGTGFADALSVGPVVWDDGYPLILTDPNTLGTSAISTIQNLGITKAIIVGGTAAVSAAIETQLTSNGVSTIYRIAGADRTATAGMIATWAVSGLPASGSFAALPAPGGFGPTVANVARGDNFADALASGPHSGNNGQVILLTGSPTVAGTGAGTYLSGRTTVHSVEQLGLAAAITPATLNAVVAQIG